MSKPTTESSLSAFAKSIEQSVLSTILPAFVEYVNKRIADDSSEEKEFQDFTEDEIIKGLKMAKVRVAPVFTGGGINSSAASKPAAARKSTATDDETDGRCWFRVTRGADLGKCCGKKAVDGTNYCSSPSHVDGGKERKTPAVKKGSTSAFTKKPSSLKKEEETEEEEISVEVLENLENDVLVLTGKLVVTEGKNNDDEPEYTLYGIQVEGQTIKPLIPTQVKKYKEQGYIIETDEDIITDLGLTIEKPKETKKPLLPPPTKKAATATASGGKIVTSKVDELVSDSSTKKPSSGVRPPALKKNEGKQLPPSMPSSPVNNEDESKDE